MRPSSYSYYTDRLGAGGVMARIFSAAGVEVECIGPVESPPGEPYDHRAGHAARLRIDELEELERRRAAPRASAVKAGRINRKRARLLWQRVYRAARLLTSRQPRAIAERGPELAWAWRYRAGWMREAIRAHQSTFQVWMPVPWLGWPTPLPSPESQRR